MSDHCSNRFSYQKRGGVSGGLGRDIGGVGGVWCHIGAGVRPMSGGLREGGNKGERQDAEEVIGASFYRECRPRLDLTA